MDVFCFSKDHAADMTAGRIGHFKSTPDKLKELADGFPDFLWVFRTPPGRRGEVQLLARLKWADRTTVRHKAVAGDVYIHYDPQDPKSVAFADSDSGSDSAIAATSQWASAHFPRMSSANFRGTAGQEALRGAALNELQRLAGPFGTRQFMTPAPAET